MEKQNVINKLGFERAVDIDSAHNLSVFQRDIIEQTKKFEIDKIYFSQDGSNSFPAVFIKNVTSFDSSASELIANIHQKAWNYKKVLFLYVYSETEIRIYNCSETPIFKNRKTNIEEELKEKELISCKLSDNEKLERLITVFSAVAIDTGVIWTIQEAGEYRNKINLKRRVDRYLVDSLTIASQKLIADGLEIALVHRLILRSLFLLYLEDREATDWRYLHYFIFCYLFLGGI